MKSLEHKALEYQIRQGQSHALILESRDREGLERELDTLTYRLLVHSEETRIQYEAGHPVDLVLIEEEKQIPIESIRNLIREVARKPLKSDYKLVIIKDAHKMREEAQNALLKTLEEPPAYAVFVLTTDQKTKLLPTILSRCTVFRYEEETEHEEIPEIYPLMEAAFAGRHFDSVSIPKPYEGQDEEKWLDAMEQMVYDLILYAQTGQLYGSEVKQATIKRMGHLSFSRLERVLLAIEEVKGLLQVHINFQLALEHLLLVMMEE